MKTDGAVSICFVYDGARGSVKAICFTVQVDGEQRENKGKIGKIER